MHWHVLTLTASANKNKFAMDLDSVIGFMDFGLLHEHRGVIKINICFCRLKLAYFLATFFFATDLTGVLIGTAATDFFWLAQNLSQENEH